MRALVGAFVLVAACSDGGSSAPQIARVVPGYGPLVGGTPILVGGSGFTGPIRVLVAGREAPIANPLDETTLEVVIPPGEQPGDAELVVIGTAGTAIAPHLFHYSRPPTIDTVTPASVVFSSTSTTVTLTGSGFLDEGAGDVDVLVDGQLATGVQVANDTTLSFTAPRGIALSRPELVVIDQRGNATKARAFRYRPGQRGGLLLFSRFGTAFATFFDPVDNSSVDIPRVGTTNAAFTTIVADDRGDFWGFDRSRRFGRIDMRTQTLEAPIQTSVLIPAMVRVGATHFALERLSLRFGTFDPLTGGFTPIGTDPLPCCGSYGLASDGTTLWFTARQSPNIVINTIDPITGVTGTPVPLIGSPGMHIEEMRYFHGVLFAPSADSTFLAIDPVTGVTTVLPITPSRANAMEVVE